MGVSIGYVEILALLGVLFVFDLFRRSLSSARNKIKGWKLSWFASGGVKLSPLSLKTGRFFEDGVEFKRDSPEAPLYMCKPTGREVDSDGKTLKETYTYILVNPKVLVSSLETVMPNSVFQPLAAAHRFQAAIRNSSGEILGFGFRVGSILFTCRHTFDIHGFFEKFISGQAGDAALIPLRYYTPKRQDVGGTGCDWIAFVLSADTWSRTGVTALKLTSITGGAPRTASICGFSSTHGKVKAVGPVYTDQELNRVAGVFGHRISTVKGFSGSPVVTTSGTLKVCGMHLRGTSSANYAMTGAHIRNVLLNIMREDQGPIDLSGGLETSENSEGYREAQSYYEDDAEYYHGHGYAAYDEQDFDLWSEEREARRRQAFSAYEDAWARSAIYGGDDEGGAAERHAEELLLNKRLAKLEARGLECSESVPPGLPEPKFDSIGKFESDCENFLTGLTSSQAEKAWFKALYRYGHTGELTTVYGVEMRCYATHAGDTIPAPIQPGNRVKPTGDTVKRVLNSFHLAQSYEFLIEAMTWDVDLDFINIQDSDGQYVFDALRKNVANGDGLPLEESTMYDSQGASFFKPLRKLSRASGKKVRNEPVTLSSGNAEIMRHFGLPSEWALPPNGKAAMKESMAVQAKLQSPGNLIMDEENFREYMKACEVHQRDALTPGSPVAMFNTAGSCLKNSSSGWTGKIHNLNKDKFFADPTANATLQRLVFQRLLIRAALWDKLPAMTAEEAFRSGCNDPKDIFVKDEPHGARKIRSRKWRLIWICSLADIMVSSMLNLKYHKRQIESYQSGSNRSVCAGIGHDDVGIDRVAGVIRELAGSSGVVHTQDASGWDLSVSAGHWMYAAAPQCADVQHSSNKAKLAYDVLVHADYHSTMRHLLLVDDELWECTRYGPMPSGSDKTTAVNNRARQAGLRQAGSGPATTAGDDAVTSNVPNKSVLALHGTQPRDEKTHDITSGVPFTSHTFKVSDGSVECFFENLDKSVARLLLAGKQPKADAIGGICFACRRTPESLDKWMRLCEHLGWVVPPRDDWKPSESDI